MIRKKGDYDNYGHYPIVYIDPSKVYGVMETKRGWNPQKGGDGFPALKILCEGGDVVWVYDNDGDYIHDCKVFGIK